MTRAAAFFRSLIQSGNRKAVREWASLPYTHLLRDFSVDDLRELFGIMAEDAFRIAEENQILRNQLNEVEKRWKRRKISLKSLKRSRKRG